MHNRSTTPQKDKERKHFTFLGELKTIHHRVMAFLEWIAEGENSQSTCLISE